METSPFEKRFALLIDADNVSAKYLQPILDELSNYGTVTYKRIYGDWTLASHVKWKKVLLENSITPIQQFGYTQGKNATDSAMIIDAMDILYAGGVEGFCIVSSDSDFTRLAVRLRESGRTVIGMGEKKTPIPFRKACDIFTTLELLLQDRKQDSENVTSREEIERAVVDIIVTNQNNGKGTGLGEVGSRLQKRYPDFDVRNYGTNVLSNLLESFKSVRIVKSRNNVAVLLAEDAETLAELEEKRVSEPPRRSGSPVIIEETESVSDAEDEDEEDGKSHRRRRKRRSERKTRERKPAVEEAVETSEAPENIEPEESNEPAAVVEPTETAETTDAVVEAETAEAVIEVEAAETAPAELTAESPAETPTEQPSEQPAEEPAAAAAETPAEEAAEQPAENAPAPKPKRKRRSERGKRKSKKEEAKKPAATADEPAAETHAEAASEAKPAPAEVVSEAVEAVADVAANAAAAASAAAVDAATDAAATLATAQEKANSFIQSKLTAVGEEGIPVTNLSKAVRNRFKDFKVRELGFQHLRGYLDSLGFVEIEKQGNSFIAKLKK